MKKSIVIMVCVIVLLAGVAAAATPEGFIEPGEQAPDFRLNDQHIVVQELKDFRGMPVVILNTGRERFDDTAQIIWKLEKKYNLKKRKDDPETVHVMGVAYLKGVPSFVKKKVKKHLKKPQYPRFLLDWNAEIKDKYGYHGARISVFIIDAQGIVRFSDTIVNTEEDRAKIFEEIDRVLVADQASE